MGDTLSMRVVGIFYVAKDIPFSDVAQADPSKGTTVEDLMVYLKQNAGAGGTGASNFGYIDNTVLSSGGKSVTAFAARYPQGVTSITSTDKYTAGDYFLSESTVGNPRYSVWQYYVLDENGVLLIPNPRIQSFQDSVLQKGYSVTWRLVEILSGPNRVPRVYQPGLGFGTNKDTGGSQRTVYGYIDGLSGGADLVSGSGVANVQKLSTGLYEVTFATPFTNLPSVTATQQYISGRATSGTTPGNTKDNAVVVNIKTDSCLIVTGDGDGNPNDRNFSFAATGI